MPELNLNSIASNLNAARYCSQCGKESEKCECGDQQITISICIPRGLLNLTNLIPKIQIASDKCHKCGYQHSKCDCNKESNPESNPIKY